MARSRSTEALCLQDGGLSGRETQAGGDRRRPRRDPVGERSPGPCAAEHRGGGRRASCARRDRAPARGIFCRTAEGVRVEAGFGRDGLSTQGVERIADDPVRRDAILRRDRDGRLGIPAPCARLARQTAEIPSRSSRRAIGSSDRPANSQGSPAGSTPRHVCWPWKEPRRYHPAPACYASTSEAAFDRNDSS